MAWTRRRRIWTIGLGTPLLLILVLLLLWDWNWLRPLVEAQATAALGRPVHMTHFDVRLARMPLLVLDGVTIGNPSKFGDEAMGTIGRLSVRVDLWSLRHGPVRIPEIAIERPDLAFVQTADGDANWRFGTSPSPSPDMSSGASAQIGTLTISDGTIRVKTAKPISDLTLRIATQAPADGRTGRAAGEASIVATAQGTYANQPIDGRFVGGALLSLRDPSKPYPIDLSLVNGGTHVMIKGTVERPLELAGADVTLEVQGRDLADLYPLTNIPLPPTPAYHLAGKLDYGQSKITFRHFAGTVGSSDLNGDVAVEMRAGQVPLVSGDLTSHKVVLADLAGFIGSTPGKAGSGTDTHRAERAQQEASPKLLPDKPIDLPKLRSVDLEVKYRGERIESQSTPLDNLALTLSAANGEMRLQPLSFAVGQGEIAANLDLNAQGPLIHAVGDIDFRQVDVHRLMQATKIFEGAGTIGGRIKLDTTGNSLAAMLGRGNGDVKLFMTGGDISALLVDLAGLDFGHSVLSALGLPNRAPVRCMVFDAGLDKGDLASRLLLVDTTEANVIGTGHVDLGHEQVDYQLTTEPKHFTVGALPAPIEIQGALKSPSIRPDAAALAGRGTAAAVLGVLLTPLGALIPTIQLGLGKDNDCGALLQEVEAGAKAPLKPAAGKTTTTRHKSPASERAGQP